MTTMRYKQKIEEYAKKHKQFTAIEVSYEIEKSRNVKDRYGTRLYQTTSSILRRMVNNGELYKNMQRGPKGAILYQKDPEEKKTLKFNLDFFKKYANESTN